MARGFTPGVDIGCFLQPVSAGYQDGSGNVKKMPTPLLWPTGGPRIRHSRFYIAIQTSKS